MANMSYCRFRNTLSDLQECADYMDEELSDEEEKARKLLIKLCVKIAENHEEQITVEKTKT